MTANAFLEEAKSEGIVCCVVGAVIAKASTVLLLRRKTDDFMGGIYELPSGQVEDGESLESALRREIFEETSLEIVDIRRHARDYEVLTHHSEALIQIAIIHLLLKRIK